MAPHTPKVVRSAISIFFEYDTPRIVHIRSKKVGIINRLLQLTILAYIIGYAIIYKKGYQDFENVQSAVSTKVKGIIFSNNTAIPNIGARTWDVADYVIPPQENSAFFVMTNVIATPKQSQTTCAEDPTVDGGKVECTNDTYCESMKEMILSGGNGPLTGRCVNATTNSTKTGKVCEIFGWCPVEDDDYFEKTEPVLAGSRNFTVFIKNNIQFPKFGVKRRNLPTKESDSYLKSCLYNSHNSRDKFCPIFLLSTIVEGAGMNYTEVAKEGAVMQIVIDWTCNLDYSIDDCVPSYTFRRLDKGDFNISKGFNFRYADQFGMMENDTYRLYRNLYKAYGILFVVNVQGKAGKFNIVPLTLNIGSGLALLGVATILCDLVVLYVLKAKNFYRDKKYLDVKGQDAFETLEEEDDSDGGANSGAKRRNLSGSQNSVTNPARQDLS